MVRYSDVLPKTFLWTGNSGHFKKWLEGFDSLGIQINLGTNMHHPNQGSHQKIPIIGPLGVVFVFVLIGNREVTYCTF